MKVLVLSIFVLMMFSCTKRTDTPKPKDCNCGKVISSNVYEKSVSIINQCSGNLKTFILSEDSWKKAIINNKFCLINEW